MRKQILTAFIAAILMIPALAGCNGKNGAAASSPPPLIAEDITAADVSHTVSGRVTEWTARGEEAAALQKWAAEMEYELQHFDKGSSPGDADGAEVYSFAFPEGDSPGFSYVMSGEGDACLLIGGEWYAVSNPSAPPVAAP